MIINFILIVSIFCGCSSDCKNAIDQSIIVNETNNQHSETDSKLSSHLEKSLDPAYEKSQHINNYTVNLDIDTHSRTVSGIEKIKYKNTSDIDIPELFINVYANAFSKETNTVPYLEEYKHNVFNSGMDYSNFQINSLSVNNKGVAFSLENTILQINLNEPLKVNDEIEIILQFESYIPPISHRLGGNKDSMWFGNFIPSMAVYDENGWHKNTYYPVGEPFYSDISNYNVTIKAPKTYTVVTTGVSKTIEQGDKNITSVDARMIRNFAFALSNSYVKKTIETRDGITINLYHFADDSENIDLFLNVAKSSLEYYVENVGSYPYRELDITECELFYPGDMEYSQFVMVDKSYLTMSNTIDLITYDFGLQWFNCIIGIDQINEGWLNKGITGFLQNLIYYPEDKFEDIMESEYKILEKELKKENNPTLNASLEDYKTMTSYNNVQCRRSRLMIYSLYKKIGHENFSKLLKTYYSSYSFKNVTSEDFFKTCEEVYGKDLSEFFEKWIYDNKMPYLYD